MNPECNWEPVEVVKDRADVISVVGGGENAGSGVRDVLTLIVDFVR